MHDTEPLPTEKMWGSQALDMPSCIRLIGEGLCWRRQRDWQANRQGLQLQR